MLANHTSIASVSSRVGPKMQKNSLALTHTLTFAQLFKRMLDQFDRLKKRNAFVEQYKKERMFENGLEEFDDARYGSYRVLHLTTVNDSRCH
jgi:hypothetical protein